MIIIPLILLPLAFAEYSHSLRNHGQVIHTIIGLFNNITDPLLPATPSEATFADAPADAPAVATRMPEIEITASPQSPTATTSTYSKQATESLTATTTSAESSTSPSLHPSPGTDTPSPTSPSDPDATETVLETSAQQPSSTIDPAFILGIVFASVAGCVMIVALVLYKTRPSPKKAGFFGSKFIETRKASMSTNRSSFAAQYGLADFLNRVPESRESAIETGRFKIDHQQLTKHSSI
jgi:hypothetical protein